MNRREAALASAEVVMRESTDEDGPTAVDAATTEAPVASARLGSWVEKSSSPETATATAAAMQDTFPLGSLRAGPIRPRPLELVSPTKRNLEVDAVGEAVLRQVEQMDTFINANATRRSFVSARHTSSRRRQSVGKIATYLEQKALSLLESETGTQRAADTGELDPGKCEATVAIEENTATMESPSNSRKVHPATETKQHSGSSAEHANRTNSAGGIDMQDRKRRQSTRRSIADRLSSLTHDGSDARASTTASFGPGRKNSRMDSRRRSSITASIKEDVSKFKQTVTRMFEKASQIKVDDERAARVAELVDSEVMILNANQLAQNQRHKANRLMISVHSRFRHWWDFAITVCIAYVIVMTPIKVGFDVQTTGAGYALDVVVDLFYLVEMVLNFFTSYEDDATGDEVKDPVKIRRNYIKSWFLVDAVSSFPSSLIGATNGLLTLSKILKVARVAKVSDSGLVRTLAGRIDRSMNPSVLRMLKLTIIFLVSQHLIACTYYYISLNQGTETTWGPTNEIRQSKSLGNQYVDAFYFAIMVTTANDVNPNTPIEKLFTSVMLFVGIVINASIIGSAANLLSNLDKEEIARKNQMDSINDYLRFKKVPLNLQNKIRRYYDYALTTRLQDPTESLFADLPDRLKLLLKLNLHAEFVRRVPLFRALSHAGVVAIIQCLVPVVVMPGEVIIAEGEMANEFYFIKSGQVSLCVPALMSTIPLGNLGEGSFFGEASLLTGEPATAEVRAERMCELLYLSKDDFGAIVDKFPTFFLAVRRISESRMQTAQNVQKMSKMNRRPTQMLQIKQLSFHSLAKTALLKSRIGSGLSANKSAGTSGRSAGRAASLMGGKRLLSSSRRKTAPSFDANFIERLSLAQARHLTHLRSMRDMQGSTEDNLLRTSEQERGKIADLQSSLDLVDRRMEEDIREPGANSSSGAAMGATSTTPASELVSETPVGNEPAPGSNRGKSSVGKKSETSAPRSEEKSASGKAVASTTQPPGEEISLLNAEEANKGQEQLTTEASVAPGSSVETTTTPNAASSSTTPEPEPSSTSAPGVSHSNARKPKTSASGTLTPAAGNGASSDKGATTTTPSPTLSAESPAESVTLPPSSPTSDASRSKRKTPDATRSPASDASATAAPSSANAVELDSQGQEGSQGSQELNTKDQSSKGPHNADKGKSGQDNSDGGNKGQGNGNRDKPEQATASEDKGKGSDHQGSQGQGNGNRDKQEQATASEDKGKGSDHQGSQGQGNGNRDKQEQATASEDKGKGSDHQGSQGQGNGNRDKQEQATASEDKGNGSDHQGSQGHGNVDEVHEGRDQGNQSQDNAGGANQGQGKKDQGHQAQDKGGQEDGGQKNGSDGNTKQEHVSNGHGSEASKDNPSASHHSQESNAPALSGGTPASSGSRSGSPPSGQESTMRTPSVPSTSTDVGTASTTPAPEPHTTHPIVPQTEHGLTPSVAPSNLRSSSGGTTSEETATPAASAQARSSDAKAASSEAPSVSGDDEPHDVKADTEATAHGTTAPAEPNTASSSNQAAAPRQPESTASAATSEKHVDGEPLPAPDGEKQPEKASATSSASSKHDSAEKPSKAPGDTKSKSDHKATDTVEALTVDTGTSVTQDAKQYVRGDDTQQSVLAGGSGTFEGDDVAGASGEPLVIGGRKRGWQASAQSGLYAVSSRFHNILRFSTCVAALLSVALLLAFHFEALNDRLACHFPVGSSWSPNTWEFVLYVGYIQQISAFSAMTLLQTPYFLWDFTDLFSWTNFLIYRAQDDLTSSSSGSDRRLTTIILGGLVGYGDRIGTNESMLLCHVCAGFALVALVFLVLAFGANVLGRWHRGDNNRGRSVSLRCLGLAVLVWFFGLFPLSMAVSFEISMELQARVFVLPLLLLAFAVVIAGFFGVVALAGRAILHRTDRELLAFWPRAVWGTFYLDYSYPGRLFFLLSVTLQIAMGLCIGMLDANETMLLLLIALHMVFIAAVFVMQPFLDRSTLAKRSTYAVNGLKIANLGLAFAFLPSANLGMSGLFCAANVFVGVNGLVIVIWSLRHLAIFGTLVVALRVREGGEPDEQDEERRVEASPANVPSYELATKPR
ncbi:hypothetical protein BBJ28_00005187 [Nothophytophthora sp. Chile5]|nr:hypothetical protein BBJ28_00005187 [Nothophytophthora sp. Chile5]